MPDRIIRDELLESPRWVSLKDNADMTLPEPLERDVLADQDVWKMLPTVGTAA